MHRSGTSFLARALNLSGVYLGDLESLTSHEWKFFEDNLRGHWENKEFLALTQKTLSSNKGKWDKIPSKIVLNKKLGKNITKAVNDLMKHGSLAAGFKDPRIIPCLESWVKYLPKDIILIGIFRNPLKVAESLKIRDGFSYEKSLSLWKTYNEKLLSHLEKQGGFLLDFDWSEKRLISELKLISKKLGLYQNIDLSGWYTKKIIKADKSYKADYSLRPDLKRIYSNLKKRSAKNSRVKVKKIKRTSKELEKIIQNQLIQSQKQGQYFKAINQQTLKLLGTIKVKKPISLLISIYSKRPDLQDAYPEVVKGDYERIVGWAISVCHGKIKDLENKNKQLAKFVPQFKEYQKSFLLTKTDLSKKIQKISELNEKLNQQKALLEENKGLSKRLSAKNLEIERRIGELESVKQESEKKIEDLISSNLEKSSRINLLENESQKLQESKFQIESELHSLKGSIPYIIAKDLTSYLDEKVPPNTKRGRLLRKIIFKKYKKLISEQSHLIGSKFFYDYEFNDTVDKTSLSNLLNSLKYQPKISIIMPVYNIKIPFLKNAIESVKNQYYSNWQLCICDDNSTDKEIHKILKEESEKNDRILVTFSEKNEGISSSSNKALSLAKGDYTLLLDHDDMLSKNALLEIVKTLNENKELDFIYSDEDKLDKNGKHVEPFFKPNWSPDLFFSYNFPIHVSVFRTSLLNKIGGFRKGFEGAQDYDLILRYLEQTQKIAHIPKVLYSWRKSPGSTALAPFEKDYAYGAGRRALGEAIKRRKIDAVCEGGIQMGTYRIRYKIQGNPLVSIIIPTKTLQNVEVCLSSILKKSTFRNFEVIVMDGSKDDKINNFCQNYNQVKCKKFSQEKFNFSKINNEGVSYSKGEYLVFLNDDTEVISPDWIEGLLEHAQRDEIGIVGSKLLYKDDHVQHAGTVIGIQQHAGNYGQMHKNDEGYFSFAKIIRNCSAVTAACMMMKKENFTQVNGFDEKLANSWQDVDLCIRVLEAGKLIVYSPFSTLYHYEGKTRGSLDASKEELDARKIFREKHYKFIKKGDPYYNPNFSLVVPFKVVRNYTKPLRDLVELYEKREDLRKNFPNEQKNNFRNLIDWAGGYHHMIY